MEMLKRNEKRRRLFAVAIFLGVSTATATVAASQTEYIKSNELPVVEMEFFNEGEFSSSQNFSKAIVDAAKFGATYWRDVLSLQATNQSPWQIALTATAQPIINAKTFSFNQAIPVQDNYLAQMLQHNRTLVPFDLKSLANEKITAEEIQAALQRNSSLEGDTAVSVVTIGKNIGANRNGSSWSVDADTILPTNEQAADLVGALRLEMARALGADSLIPPFNGENVSEVLEGATLEGKPVPGLLGDLPYKNYTTLTELELAAMQDIGYCIDMKKFYGKSIYAGGGTFTNAADFKSEAPLAVGLHVWGANNNVTQSGDINLTGAGAVGIRVDGFNNSLVIPQNTTINSDGLRGKGLLISYGRDHKFDVGGNISAAGNAVEFNFGSNILGAGGEYRGSYLCYLRGVNSSGNITSATNLPLLMTDGFSYASDELNGALVDEFNLTGSLTGGEHAIYIGKNAFVRNINFNKGATISGDIVSDWKHFTAADGFNYPVMIQYGGQKIDASHYVPDLVTNLNFNGSINYDGNISGADNIKLKVNGGTLKFSGTADVLNVEVGRGAKLYGGKFTLHDMSGDIASSFTDSTTGKFINHGTIAARNPDTNLIINGDLISDGTIKKVSGGKGGSIIVSGNANVEGSLVTTDSLLPNQTETVLTADSITGKIRNPLGNPVPISGMLTATGDIVGNMLTVTTHESNNLGDLEPQEAETFNAMNNMLENLEDEEQQDEMRDLFNLTPSEAKKTLTEISSNDSAQVMSVAQQNTAVDKMIAYRVAEVFSPNLAPDYVELKFRPLKFADDEDYSPDMKVRVKVPSRHENNLWLNYMKNWGSLRGGTDYHGSVIVAGYDKPIGQKWRAGIFATYGTIGYGIESSRATIYDTRFGLYAGYHNRASDVYIYLNGGQLRNSLQRGISALGLSTNAKYKSRIVELGGEYKYDLQPRRKWHVSPYVNFQTSHLWQNSYNEHGAGIYNHHVEADNNTYFAAQTGLDFKRYYQSGMFGFRFGVKHGFTGADPDLRISYEGDSGNSYRLRNKRDKTHFVLGVRGENEFANGWFLGGEAELQRGENDKDVTASLMLRRIW